MRKKRKSNLFFSGVLLAFLVPLLIIVILQQIKLDELMQDAQAAEADVPAEEELEKKVLLAVAKEIPVTAEPEAVRAQCVIARTNLAAAIEKGTGEPQAFTLEELQELWGTQFQTYYDTLEELVSSTQGQILAYQGNCIYAAYHAVSAGETRAMAEIYPEVEMPYLTIVEAHEDAQAHDYVSVFTWDRETFVTLCSETYPGCGLEQPEELLIQTRDTAGYVLTLALGTLRLTGEEFRNALNLPSACFSVTIDEKKVRIVTKGRGHGLGLSQYAANYMAENGTAYPEILLRFYPGCELLTYKP